MKRKNKIPVLGVLKDIISPPKKREPPQKRTPEAYYKTMWCTKKAYDGIELVARIEGVSKKKAHAMLLERAISLYMGELIKQHVENERYNREQAEDDVKRATIKGVKVARRYLEESGISEYRSKKGGL